MMTNGEGRGDGRSRALLKGTLNLLVLRTLDVADGPQHGWNIGKLIADRSDGVLSVTQGSLYPALHRMESEGWIVGAWQTSPLGKRARYYSLTRRGRRALAREIERWVEVAQVTGKALGLDYGVG